MRRWLTSAVEGLDMAQVEDPGGFIAIMQDVSRQITELEQMTSGTMPERHDELLRSYEQVGSLLDGMNALLKVWRDRFGGKIPTE